MRRLLALVLAAAFPLLACGEIKDSLSKDIYINLERGDAQWNRFVPVGSESSFNVYTLTGTNVYSLTGKDIFFRYGKAKQSSPVGTVTGTVHGSYATFHWFPTNFPYAFNNWYSAIVITNATTYMNAGWGVLNAESDSAIDASATLLLQRLINLTLYEPYGDPSEWLDVFGIDSNVVSGALTSVVDNATFVSLTQSGHTLTLTDNVQSVTNTAIYRNAVTGVTENAAHLIATRTGRSVVITETGFGSAADSNATKFATAQQGALAATAVQDGDVTASGLGGPDATVTNYYITLQQLAGTLGAATTYYLSTNDVYGIGYYAASSSVPWYATATLTSGALTAGAYPFSWVVAPSSAVSYIDGGLARVHIHARRVGGAALTVRAEIYALYADGTMPELFDAGETVALGTTEAALSLEIPTTNVTLGAAVTGVVARLKAVSASGNPALAVRVGSDTLSGVTLPTPVTLVTPETWPGVSNLYPLAASLGNAAYSNPIAFAPALQGAQGAAAYLWGDHAAAGYQSTGSTEFVAAQGQQAAVSNRTAYLEIKGSDGTNYFRQAGTLILIGGGVNAENSLGYDYVVTGTAYVPGDPVQSPNGNYTNAGSLNGWPFYVLEGGVFRIAATDAGGSYAVQLIETPIVQWTGVGLGEGEIPGTYTPPGETAQGTATVARAAMPTNAICIAAIPGTVLARDNVIQLGTNVVVDLLTGEVQSKSVGMDTWLAAKAALSHTHYTSSALAPGGVAGQVLTMGATTSYWGSAAGGTTTDAYARAVGEAAAVTNQAQQATLAGLLETQDVHTAWAASASNNIYLAGSNCAWSLLAQWNATNNLVRWYSGALNGTNGVYTTMDGTNGWLLFK